MSYRNFSPRKYEGQLEKIFKDLFNLNIENFYALRQILNKYPKDKKYIFSKDELISGFLFLQEKGLFKNKDIPNFLKLKPTRTISGVTVVTVLTKPFKCPGQCIFCPNDVSMPKSYISSEPGAQRALLNRFDPYLQVYNRLKALIMIGHPVQKIELLILGGTWSYYPESYQIWFVKECFRALNDFNLKNLKNFEDNSSFIKKWKLLVDNLRKKYSNLSYNEILDLKDYKDGLLKILFNQKQNATWNELLVEQKKNEKAFCRNVGLVLETRPDKLNEKEVLKLRKFGATKIQIGVQTLNPIVNKANKRYETIEQIANAFNLLRLAGFKIHAHIMPNLYKSTPKKDLETFLKLFLDENFKPDELKIYPTSLINYTKLFELFKKGEYKPYDQKTLVNLLSEFFVNTPEYCRLSRVIRDIPSTEIISGNKITNLRQLVEEKIKKEGKHLSDIRSREVRDLQVQRKDLNLDILCYKTRVSYEYFLQFITNTRKIAGFLRLSIPKKNKSPITNELDNSAIIREIHIYGQSLKLNQKEKGASQHLGLGVELIEKAKEIARLFRYKKISVISAIGTREYYRKRGFQDGILYQYITL